MISADRLISLISEYGSANVKFALALSGTDDETIATNKVLDLYQQIAKAVGEIYGENERMSIAIDTAEEAIKAASLWGMEKQPACGHPKACIERDEDDQWCAWCASLEQQVGA